MLCIKCKKRQAVVYIQRQEGSETKSEGYCLTCAKELGIKPVEDLISKMGISDEDLETVQDQMNTLMQGMGENGDMSQLMEQLGADNLAEQMEQFKEEAPGSDDDDFSHGAPAFPNFFKNIFGGGAPNAQIGNGAQTGKKDKKEKKPEKKTVAKKTGEKK